MVLLIANDTEVGSAFGCQILATALLIDHCELRTPLAYGLLRVVSGRLRACAERVAGIRRVITDEGGFTGWLASC